MMPSVTCLQLSDVSVICRVTYFQFPIQSAFLPCRSARQRSCVLALPNIRHQTLPKIWIGFLYGAYSPGELFWIDSNGKMETRHPVEGSFIGSEFPAICNHCIFMAAWNRTMLKFCEKFLLFWEKTTPYAKIFKILFRKFIITPIDVCVFNQML